MGALSYNPAHPHPLQIDIGLPVRKALKRTETGDYVVRFVMRYRDDGRFSNFFDVKITDYGTELRVESYGSVKEPTKSRRRR